MASPVILWIVIIYLVIVMLIGYYASRFQKSMEDFYIAGRRIGTIVVGLALAGAHYSGFSFIGIPGSVYKVGPVIASFGIATAAGYALMQWTLGKPMYYLSKKFGSLTVPDLIELRYNSSILRVIMSLSILLCSIGYLALNFMAAGRICEQILGVPYQVGLIVSVIVIAGYCILGGHLAAIWTSAFQSILLALCSILLFIIGLKLTGGFTNQMSVIGQANPIYVRAWHPSGGLGFTMWLSFLFLYPMGFLGAPHITTKYYTITKAGALRWSALIGAIILSCGCFVYFLGSTMRYLTIQGVIPELANPDMVIPVFLANFTHPALAGLVIAGAIAAIMSTADAFLIVASSTLVRDLYEQLYLKSKNITLDVRKGLLYSRIATALIVIACCYLCYNPIDVITWLGNASWGLGAATVGPILLLGLRVRGITKSGAIAGALVGFCISFGCYVGKLFKIIPEFYYIDYNVWGIIGCVLVMVIVSLLTVPESNAVMQYIDEELSQAS